MTVSGLEGEGKLADRAGRTVAHVDAVGKFFEQKKKDAIRQMEDWDDAAA